MLLYDDGVRRLTVRYVQLRNGVYFYRRRYPTDLLGHFGGVRFKLQSLHTKSAAEAAKRAAQLAAQDDAEWQALRTNPSDMSSATPKDVTRIAQTILTKMGHRPGERLSDFDKDEVWSEVQSWHYPFMEQYRAEHGELPDPSEYLTPVDHEVMRISRGTPAPKRLSDALEYYLKEHPKGQQKKFAADARRSVGHVIRVAGDLPLEQYAPIHAENVRDDLLHSAKTGTVRRHFNAIGVVFKKANKGFNLRLATNPFWELGIIGEGDDVKVKLTFTHDELQTLAGAAHTADDTLRHIAAMLLNTGARVSEIVGLKCSDLVLSGKAPYVSIQPHLEAGRQLKTKGSKRVVPLVGVSLSAAKSAHAAATKSGSIWLFPHYVDSLQSGKFNVKSGSAGTALNKWIKATVRADKTSHCFRHTMRDRLRAIAAPREIQDLVGGWGTKSTGQEYGDGYTAEFLLRYLRKIAI